MPLVTINHGDTVAAGSTRTMRPIAAGARMAEEIYDKKNIEHIFAANKKWAAAMTRSDKV